MISRIALVSLLLWSGAAAADSVDALVEAGHFKRAAAALQGLLSAEPNNAHLLYRLAQCQEAFGNIEAALQTARRAAALDPRNASYRAMVAEILGEKAARASTFSALGLARSAKSEAEAAVAIDPRNLNALNTLAQFLAHAPGIAGGNRDQAIKLAAQMASIDPARGYIVQAELPWQKPKEAEQLFTKALQADPARYDVHIALALHHWRQKNYTASEASAHRAIQLRPDRITGYEMLVRVAGDTQNLAELDRTLAASEQAVADNLSPYFFAGRRLLAAGGDPLRAASYLRKYLSAEPEGDAPSPAVAHWQLGVALAKANRRNEAVSELEAAVKLDGNLKQAKEELKRLR
jgi:tetratricopeptide (TPR) repeat protein